MCDDFYKKSSRDNDKQKEIIIHCLTRQIVVSDYDIPFHDLVLHVMHLPLCALLAG